MKKKYEESMAHEKKEHMMEGECKEHKGYKCEHKKTKMPKSAAKKKKFEHKMEKVMGEYKEGKLHSGSKRGPVAANRKQAVAIALSEARKATGKKKK